MRFQESLFGCTGTIGTPEHVEELPDRSAGTHPQRLQERMLDAVPRVSKRAAPMKISSKKVRCLLELGIALAVAIGTPLLAHVGLEYFGASTADQFVTSTQTPGGTSTSSQPISIPDYTGNPSVTLSDTSGLSPKSAPADPILPDLDASGRCGSVEMVVSLETAPSRGERRGSIGMVKPSGWHTVRDDSLDGRYLYNRCHLIAWCLTGMNAEKRNLITGTRYMNVEGMLPYETKVSDFIFAGGGRVYYRVTPDFRKGELVARGVRIQAYSLADRGKGVDFDVYCYNVQPGYRIDYATGKAAKVK